MHEVEDAHACLELPLHVLGRLAVHRLIVGELHLLKFWDCPFHEHFERLARPNMAGQIVRVDLERLGERLYVRHRRVDFTQFGPANKVRGDADAVGECLDRDAGPLT